jgi:hypothetical protein
MPRTEALDGIAADASRPPTSTENQSIWTKELLPTPPSTKAVATRGPITCPYCGFVTVDDANLLGQRVLCSKCNANFRAPDCRAEQKRARAALALLKYIVGITLVIIGFRGFMRGEVEVYPFTMFAIGFGIIALTLYGSLKRFVSIS